MRLWDERGRLFGRINVVDLVIVIVLLGAALWFGYARFFRDLRGDIAQREGPLEIVVVAGNVRPTTAEAIRNSERVFEFKTGAFVGEVQGVTTEPADVWLVNDEGRLLRAKCEDRVDAYVTVRGTARFGQDVITMNGVEVRVGGSIGLKSKFAVFTGYVVKMDAVAEGASQ